MNKQYIGDAVYAEVSQYGELIVTTEDGVAATNRIILEPETWRDLLAYARQNWLYEHRRHHAEMHAIVERVRPESKHHPEWLSQALNEGDGTYKP